MDDELKPEQQCINDGVTDELPAKDFIFRATVHTMMGVGE